VDLEPDPERPAHQDPGVQLLADVKPHQLEDGADPTTVVAAWWPLSDLTPWEDNPRNHPARQVKGLAALIRRHGFTTVLTAHWPTRRIVKGHGRRLSMLAILKADPEFTIPGAPGPGYVPVRFKGGTWEDAVRDLVADNRIQEEATWRTDGLAAIMADWSAAGDTAARIAEESGFSAVEVLELVKRAEGKPDPRAVAPPACPPPPRVADSKPGTVYQLGPHRLVCGDCTSVTTLALALGGDAASGFTDLADLVFTDPPFAIYGSSTGLGADIADDKLIRPFFRSILDMIRRVGRPWAHAYVCCDWRSWAAWWDAAGLVKLTAKNKLIWDKGGGGLGSQWANSYEEIGFFSNVPERTRMFSAPSGGARMVLKSNVIHGFPATDGDDGPERGNLVAEDPDGVELEDGRRALLRYNRVTGAERVHNAAKPIGLIQELIEASTDPDHLVVDLFGGGGTTLLAAARTGRRAVLCELSPAWCDVIRHRWTAWAREAMIDPGPGALVLEGGPAVLGA
jgi:DNA modification methylase